MHAPTPVRVLPVTEDQINAMVRLLAEIEEEVPESDRPLADVAARRALALRRLLADESGLCLLAVSSSGDPVGFAIAVRIPKLDRRVGFLYVDELHVRADWRRQGVGTALMDYVMTVASDLGLAGIRLLARPENTAALAFYESLEFTGSSSIFYQRLIESQGPRF
jgi:ribosomal protein S18 acetylase RimI-like enzyme